MSFSLALVVVDAQIDYCDPIKGKLAVCDKAFDLNPFFNEILAMKAFVIRAATMNLPPKHHKTIPHDHHNPAKKSSSKCPTPSRYPSMRLTSGDFGLHIVDLERRAGGIIDLVVSKNVLECRNISSKRLRSSDSRNTHANNKTEMAEGAAPHYWEEELKERSVTDTFCVGAAGGICVAHTAIHAV